MALATMCQSVPVNVKVVVVVRVVVVAVAVVVLLRLLKCLLSCVIGWEKAMPPPGHTFGADNTWPHVCLSVGA